MQSNQDAIPQGGDAIKFSLINAANGDTVELADFNGKPVCIIFMCNHCPYVVPKMKDIAGLQDHGIPIICINPNNNPGYPDDNYDNTVKKAKELGLKYYLFDEDQSIAKAYGAVCTPDPFVFDKHHKLIYHGRINDDLGTTNSPSRHDLQEVLEAVQNGEEIEDWFRPSQGCSIKWV